MTSPDYLLNFKTRVLKALAQNGSTDVRVTDAELDSIRSCERCGAQVSAFDHYRMTPDRSGLCKFCGGSVFVDFVFYFIGDLNCEWISVAPNTRLMVIREQQR